MECWGLNVTIARGREWTAARTGTWVHSNPQLRHGLHQAMILVWEPGNLLRGRWTGQHLRINSAPDPCCSVCQPWPYNNYALDRGAGKGLLVHCPGRGAFS